MYISKETAEETESRLLKVIAEAELEVFEKNYAFEEFPLQDFCANAKGDALAYVRDKEVWSQLIPSEDKAKELFTVIGFHFKPGFDNSGFVGWLATHLKQKLGTGVFVVCGQNSNKGGIFDYWGSPVEIGNAFIEEVQSLIAKGKNI
ncbi:MAG: DUF6196 family protein [Clostridia bacterium]|nr:DUF6196 family protein [Clostridia bacterium]